MQLGFRVSGFGILGRRADKRFLQGLLSQHGSNIVQLGGR